MRKGLIVMLLGCLFAARAALAAASDGDTGPEPESLMLRTLGPDRDVLHRRHRLFAAPVRTMAI